MLAKPFLFWYHRYSVIYNTKILTPCWSQGVSDHKEVRKSMNKYELAVVLSAKLEDEERAAAKEGFYYFVHFESDSVCPNEVENHIRIMEPVIRYLCVRQDA